MRAPMRFATLSLLCLPFAACGADDEPAARDLADKYPRVTDPPPRTGTVTHTSSSGAIEIKPPKPTTHGTKSSATCERRPYAAENRTYIPPPKPGLVAHALSEREIELRWSFSERPHDCAPTMVLLSVNANDASGATPKNAQVPVDADRGVARIAYYEFLPPPDVALATAYTRDGKPSRVTRVLIRR